MNLFDYILTKKIGGGGGGIPLLSRAEWKTLTKAQKQAYELVAVQDSTTGYDQGELYFGADYSPWCREDAIVVMDGTVVMTHDGGNQKQPIIKTNYGEAGGIFCYNSGGEAWYGNWFTVYLIGRSAADCAFTSGQTTPSKGSFVYGGKTYYYCMQAMSPSWGGAETYNNPLNLPELHDVQTFVVNGEALTSEGAIAIGDALQLA